MAGPFGRHGTLPRDGQPPGNVLPMVPPGSTQSRPGGLRGPGDPISPAPTGKPVIEGEEARQLGLRCVLASPEGCGERVRGCPGQSPRHSEPLRNGCEAAASGWQQRGGESQEAWAAGRSHPAPVLPGPESRRAGHRALSCVRWRSVGCSCQPQARKRGRGESTGKEREARERMPHGPPALVLPRVPEEGLEPSRPCGQRILNPPRLPIPPLRQQGGS